MMELMHSFIQLLVSLSFLITFGVVICYLDEDTCQFVYSGLLKLQVDLCFDQLVYKLSENIFGYYKSRAAR